MNNGKTFLTVFIPMLAAFVAGKVIVQIDLVMIAGLGVEAVAAFAVPSRVMLIDLIVAFSIAPVVSVMVARAAPGPDRRDTVTRALALSFYVSLAVTLAGVIAYPRLVSTIVATDNVAELARQATFWLTIAIPIRVMQFVAVMALYAVGRGTRFLWVLCVSLLLKVPLNLVLIDVMGFQGCFVATAVISVIEFAAALWLLRAELDTRRMWVPPSWTWVAGFTRQALPEAGRVSAYFGLMFVVLTLYASEAAWVPRLSAYTVAMELQVLLSMPMIAAMRSVAVMLAARTRSDGVSPYLASRPVAVAGGAIAVLVGAAVLLGGDALGAIVYQLPRAALEWWTPYTVVALALIPVTFLGTLQRGIWHSQQRYNFVFLTESAAQWGLLLPSAYLGLRWDAPWIAWSGMLLSEIAVGVVLYVFRHGIERQAAPVAA